MSLRALNIEPDADGEYTCENCRNNTFRVLYIKPHIGLYCSKCGKWIRWIKK